MKLPRGTCGALRGALVLFALGTGGASASAVAAELVVYSTKDCVVTRRFRREVPEQYKHTRAGQAFPLLHVDVAKGNPGVVLAQPVTTSPTFVFVDKGREIARFVGYPGRRHFLLLTDAATDAFLEQRGSR